MLYLVLLPLGIVAAVLVYLALQPGEIRARQSLIIARERSDVFDTLCDFRTWGEWSPWLLHEPDARLEYSDAPDRQGGWYAWDGSIIGAGKLKHLRLEPPERVEQRISFTRPFKSTAAVSWELVDQPAGTEVFWTLRGRMPFMLRFLAPIMSEAVDKDFRLGLILLRAYLDPDAPQLRIRFVGEREQPAQTAWAIPFKGRMEDMVQAMAAGFPRLSSAAAQIGITPTGPAFTAYHTADPKGRGFACDLALPVPEDTAAADFEIRRFDGGRYFLTEVQGSYDFLEPIWYAVMGHLRMAKHVWDRKRPSLEVYAVDPGEAKNEDDILTRIYVPIR